MPVLIAFLLKYGRLALHFYFGAWRTVGLKVTLLFSSLFHKAVWSVFLILKEGSCPPLLQNFMPKCHSPLMTFTSSQLGKSSYEFLWVYLD